MNLVGSMQILINKKHKKETSSDHLHQHTPMISIKDELKFFNIFKTIQSYILAILVKLFCKI